MSCWRRFTALSKSHFDKGQRGKEIDITNENPNEEPTDHTGVSLMTKRSEIKSPKLLRTGIFPSLCLLCNQSRKKFGVLNKSLL